MNVEPWLTFCAVKLQNLFRMNKNLNFFLKICSHKIKKAAVMAAFS